MRVSPGDRRVNDAGKVCEVVKYDPRTDVVEWCFLSEAGLYALHAENWAKLKRPVPKSIVIHRSYCNKKVTATGWDADRNEITFKYDVSGSERHRITVEKWSGLKLTTSIKGRDFITSFDVNDEVFATRGRFIVTQVTPSSMDLKSVSDMSVIRCTGLTYDEHGLAVISGQCVRPSALYRVGDSCLYDGRRCIVDTVLESGQYYLTWPATSNGMKSGGKWVDAGPVHEETSRAAGLVSLGTDEHGNQYHTAVKKPTSVISVSAGDAFKKFAAAIDKFTPISRAERHAKALEDTRRTKLQSTSADVTAEPDCICEFVGWGHVPGCKWKEWNDAR